MKILFLAPEPFFEARGTPIAVFNLIQVLTKIGHQIDLVTYHLGQNVTLENLKIKRIPKIFFVKKVPIGPSYRKLFLDFFLFFRAFFLCLTCKYDLIHGVEEGAYLGAVLSKIFKIPLVYDMDSNIPDQLKYSGFKAIFFLKNFINWFENFTINKAFAIISVCSDLSKKVAEKYPQKNLFQIEDLPLFEGMIYKNSDVENLRFQLGIGKEPVVLYTGNFENYQGVELLIEAGKKVLEVFPEVKFVFLGGEDSQIKKMKLLLSSFEKINNFIFVGKKQPEDVFLYLQIASVLVSPRLKGTNVPMKIYSYLLSGKPIVATRVLSHTQILDDKTALLVEPNAFELAEGIIKVLSSSDFAQKLALNGKQLAESQFSRKIYEEKVKKAFDFIQKSLTKK